MMADRDRRGRAILGLQEYLRFALPGQRARHIKELAHTRDDRRGIGRHQRFQDSSQPRLAGFRPRSLCGRRHQLQFVRTTGNAPCEQEHIGLFELGWLAPGIERQVHQIFDRFAKRRAAGEKRLGLSLYVISPISRRQTGRAFVLDPQQFFNLCQNHHT